MRYRIPWFTPVDRQIMGFLEDHDIIMTPKLLMHNLQERHGDDAGSRSQIQRRLDLLRDAGLLKMHGGRRGHYSLTDTGRDLVAGELDQETYERVATWRTDDR